MIIWNAFTAVGRGATLAAQVTGSDTDPALVLHYGATGSRDWWPDDLCAALAGSGFRVIRYDPRDTGESTHSPAGAPDYTGDDLADDFVAVLDAVGVERAVALGLSMGGGIVQSVAARHPSRVAGLVLVSTSPAFATDGELPPPTDEIQATFTAAPDEPDPHDRDAVVAAAIEAERPYAGPGMLDEAGIAAAIGATWDRDEDMAAASNHFLALETGSGTTVTAADLRGIPGLVVHGSADPLFPLAHGEALAAALDLPLVVLDGVGHQIPPRRFWPQLVARIAQLRPAS